MTRRHGITASTSERFVIDAGAVYTGFTDFDSLGTLLGATKGGSSFTIEQEIKEIEVDGAPGPVSGFRRIVRVKASLTCNFLEHTLTNLKRMLVGSDSATFDTSWDKITREATFDSSAFLSNIAIIGEVTDGAAGAMGIELSNVLADGNFELSFADKEEGVIAVTFTAHFDPDDLASDDNTEPWAILWPTEGT